VPKNPAAQRITTHFSQLPPQTLAYLTANAQPERPSFGMMTNGDDIVFVKLTQIDQRQYDVSRVFAPFISHQELYCVLQVLKRISQAIEVEE
jgi:hypothetical protein